MLIITYQHCKLCRAHYCCRLSDCLYTCHMLVFKTSGYNVV